MFGYLKVFILSLVQGVTEWLPVSSTGHMIIVDEFLQLGQSVEFKELFLILVQLGSIMAVVVLFFNKLNPVDFKQKKFKPETIELWKKVLVASIPAAIIGLAFDDLIDEYLFNAPVVVVMLIVYGIGFIVVENQKRPAETKDLDKITYRQALLVGAFQVLALVPGTSRSGATILGGLLLKIKRTVIAEFSFFMAIPVMFGASLLKLIKVGFDLTAAEWLLIGFGCVVAFVVSLLAIKFLLNYVKNHDFKIFGWYRIGLGALLLIYFLFKFL